MLDPDPVILARCREVLAQSELEVLVTADPCTIAYLTGFAPPFEGGPNPWAGGPPLAILTADQLCLIGADAPTGSERLEDWTVSVRGYPAYTYHYPLTSTEHYMAAVTDLAAELPRQGWGGIEGLWVPAAVSVALAEKLPQVEWLDAGGIFDEIRMVKSARELERLREVIALGDRMQQAVRDFARPGMSEVEVFGRAKSEMEHLAGGRVPVRAALRGGCGSSDVLSGDPHDYELKDGDLLLSDLLPQWRGYWADSCSTTVVGGDPSAEQARLHRIAREALQTGIDAARPGISAGELDRRIRQATARHGFAYPHHTGHGIGVSLHEAPLIWQDAPTILAEGMVIALEPGVYVPEIGGIRQEVSLLITADGAEVLSHNALTL